MIWGPTHWAASYRHNTGILLFVFKHTPQPLSILLTAGERLQASHSSVSGVQTGGHVGGWITPAVSIYEQDAQRRQLNIHSLSEIRSVKSLQAALIISHFTIWPVFTCICLSVWWSSGNQTGVNSGRSFFCSYRCRNTFFLIECKCLFAKMKRKNSRIVMRVHTLRSFLESRHRKLERLLSY